MPEGPRYDDDFYACTLPLGRNYPDKSCHCEKPQATKQSRPGEGTVAPRLLPPGGPALGGRASGGRNDSLCGIAGEKP
jgi:hypothetical protein